MNYISEKAKPFFLEGNGSKKNILVMLIHGFTGTPAHLTELAQYLNSLGFSIKVPLLPGHGVDEYEMEKSNYKDWLKGVRQSLKDEQGNFSEIFLAGISMGGLLSLILAAENSDISGVITMNTPIKFRNKSIKIAQYISMFKRFNEIVPPVVQSGENADLDIGLKRTPLRCISSLFKIRNIAMKSMKRINCRALIIQSNIDGQVLPESADIIFGRISSVNKKIIRLEKSKHICTLGLERRNVEKLVGEFICEQ